MPVQIPSSISIGFELSQSLVIDLVTALVVDLDARPLISTLQKVIDVKSYENLGSGHLSHDVEIYSEIIYYRAIVTRDPNIEIILIQQANNVGRFVELKDKVIILADLQTDYVQLGVYTYVL